MYSLLKTFATIINGNCGLTSSGKDFRIIHYYNHSYYNHSYCNPSFTREANSPNNR